MLSIQEIDSWEETVVSGENPHLYEETKQREKPSGILTRTFLLWSESAAHYTTVQPQIIDFLLQVCC